MWRFDAGMVLSTTFQGNPFNFINFGRYGHQTGNVLLGRVPTFSALGGTHVDSILRLPIHKVISFLELWEYSNEFAFISKVGPDYWQQSDISFYHLPTQDNTANFEINAFMQALVQMHGILLEGGSVYVHCKSGVGRSATFVAAYLLVNNLAARAQPIPMNYPDQFVDDAIALVKASRPIANPKACQISFLIANFPNWVDFAERLRTRNFDNMNYVNLYST